MTEEEFVSEVTDMTQTLYRVCYSQFGQQADREDAVQETLRIAWEKRGELREKNYFKTWVIRILLNQCHSLQRKNKKVIPVDQLPECFLAKDVDDRKAHDLLLSLPEKFRMPILLHDVEGFTMQDIAHILHVPLSLVKSRLRTARIRLKEIVLEEASAQ